jgi:hypothetical protein
MPKSSRFQILYIEDTGTRPIALADPIEEATLHFQLCQQDCSAVKRAETVYVMSRTRLEGCPVLP